MKLLNIPRQLLNSGVILVLFLSTHFAYANTVAGQLTIKNNATCNLHLDPNIITYDAGAQLSEPTLLKPGASTTVEYHMDRELYSKAKAEAGGKCEASGEAGLENIFNLIFNREIRGRFTTEAQCKAALNFEASIGEGIAFGAFLKVSGKFKSSNNNVESTLDISISRTGSDGVAIVSSLNNSHACGFDRGENLITPPFTLVAKKSYIWSTKSFDTKNIEVSLSDNSFSQLDLKKHAPLQATTFEWGEVDEDTITIENRGVIDDNGIRYFRADVSFKALVSLGNYRSKRVQTFNIPVKKYYINNLKNLRICMGKEQKGRLVVFNYFHESREEVCAMNKQELFKT